MLLELKKLFTGEAGCVPFDYELDLRETELYGAKPFGSPVRVTGQASGNTEGVRLSVTASFDFRVPCDRCGAPVEGRKEYRFAHELVLELQEEDREDYVLVEQYRLDLDELVRADLLLELPTKNLCSPDCKGLCPHCGANRNVEPCTCESKQADPRLEILKQLIE